VQARKIYHSGPWWVLTGGYWKHSGTSRTICDLIDRSIANAPTLGDALERFIATNRAHLADAYRVCSGLGVRLWLELYVVGVPPELGRVQVVDDHCEWGFADGDVSIMSGVPGPGLDLVAKRPLVDWIAAGNAAAARRLIGIQAGHAPHDVSAECDVLQVDATGARFV
jgi:hypothetical protein